MGATIYHPSLSKALPKARRLSLKKIQPVKTEKTKPRPAIPIDSSKLDWEAIFAIRGCPYPDGV